MIPNSNRAVTSSAIQQYLLVLFMTGFLIQAILGIYIGNVVLAYKNVETVLEEARVKKGRCE